MWAENYGKFTYLILRLLEIGSYRVFLPVFPAVTLCCKDSYKSADNSIKWQNFLLYRQTIMFVRHNSFEDCQVLEKFPNKIEPNYRESTRHSTDCAILHRSVDHNHSFIEPVHRLIEGEWIWQLIRYPHDVDVSNILI